MKHFLIALPVLLLLTIPLVYSDHLMMGASSAKYFWLYFLSLASIPAAGFYILKRSSPGITDFFVALFLVYILAQSWWLGTSIAGNRKTIIFLASGLAYFGLRYLLSWVVPAIVLLVAFIESGWGILQKFQILTSRSPVFPVTGSFFHPAPMAGFLACVLPLSCGYWWHLYKKKGKGLPLRILEWIAAGSIVSSILILPSLASRDSLAAALAGLVFLFYFNDGLRRLVEKNKRLTKRQIWIAPTICILLFIPVSIGVYKLRTQSVQGRLLVWKIASGILPGHFLAGIGMDGFRSQYPLHQIAYFRSGQASKVEERLSDEVTSPFNEALQTVLELGILGALILALIVYHALRTGKPAGDDREDMTRMMRRSAKASLIAFLVFSLASYPFSLSEMTLYFFVFVALADASSALKGGARYVIFPYRIFVLLAVLILVWQIPGTIRQWNAYRRWNEGAALGPYAALPVFREIFPALKNNQLFLFQYADNLYSAGKYDSSLQILSLKKEFMYEDYLLRAQDWDRLAQYSHAIDSYEQARYMLPHRFYPLYYEMQIYNHIDPPMARLMARKILDMDIKVDSYEVYKIRRSADSLIRAGAGTPALSRGFGAQAASRESAH